MKKGKRIIGCQLTNFKLFGDSSFDLEPITVFVGKNGSGKSSLLKGISLLPISTSSRPLSYWLGQVSGGAGAFRRGGSNLSVAINYEIFGHENNNGFLSHHLSLKKVSDLVGYRVTNEQIQIYDQDQNEVTSIVARAARGKSTYLNVKGKSSENVPEGLPSEIPAKNFELACEKSPFAFFSDRFNLTFDKLARLDPTATSFFRRDGKNDGWQEADGKALWKFIYSMCNSKKNSDWTKKKKRWIENIKMFLPWVSDIKAKKDIAGYVRIFVEEANGYVLHPRDISDGSLMLLGRLAMLETSGAVLLVDEPETHLHPHAIQKLMDLYRQVVNDPDHPICQIIIATQSPFVVGECSPAEVRVIEREAGGSEVYKFSDDPKGYQKILENNCMSLDEAWLAGL